MRRLLSIATFALLLIALPACAQRMSSGGFSHSSGSGAFAGSPTRAGFARGGVLFGHGPFFPGNFGGFNGGFFRGNFGFGGFGSFGHNPRFFIGFGNRFCSFGCGFFPRRVLFAPETVAVPVAVAVPVYPAPYTDPYANPYNTAPPQMVSDPREQDLENQVATLSAEVDQLRAQQSSTDASERAYPSAQALRHGSQLPATSHKPLATEQSPAASRQQLAAIPATVLVFRDQHLEKISDYAIVGQNLWDLSKQTPRKIPLASLDLAATTRANEDRGVEFRAPESK